MKFSMGYWKLQDDVAPLYATRVHEIEVTDDALVAYLSNSPVAERGDLLHGSVITLRFTSPIPGVIRVQAQHFKGRKPRKPDFDFDHTLKAASTTGARDATSASFTSGPLSAHLNMTIPQTFDFMGAGEVITSSKPQSLAVMQKGQKTYFRERLALGVGETIYGLGERFGPLV